MKGAASIGVIALGFVLLWAVAQGKSKNFNAAWNALIGPDSVSGSAGTSTSNDPLPPLPKLDAIGQYKLPDPTVNGGFNPYNPPGGSFLPPFQYNTPPIH